MPNIEVDILNSSTVLKDADVSAALPAFQTQVSRDFGPAWGTDATVKFVAKGASPTPGSWWLTVLDTSDQAGALGYHDLTPDGLPLGKVFAGTDISAGYQWTITATHELLEMLGDPDINLTVFVQADSNTGVLYAREACDACEADQYGYKINGTLVSDFVFPAWFETFRNPGSTQFDFQKQIGKPLQLLSGGYIGYFDVTAGTGWQQQTLADTKLTYDMRARVGSRRERRRTPRNQWLRSQPTDRR